MKPKLIPEARTVIPKWAKKIKDGNLNTEFLKAPIALSLSDYRFCIVGEANGFTDDYKRSCEICFKFSNDIPKPIDGARIKYKPGFKSYYVDLKPYMIERLISRTNKFIIHFMKAHKKS